MVVSWNGMEYDGLQVVTFVCIAGYFYVSAGAEIAFDIYNLCYASKKITPTKTNNQKKQKAKGGGSFSF